MSQSLTDEGSDNDSEDEGAAPEPDEDDGGQATDGDVSNPASMYCVEQDGTLEIRTDESGAQVGMCVFEDGSDCEEWAYFNDECQPDS